MENFSCRQTLEEKMDLIRFRNYDRKTWTFLLGDHWAETNADHRELVLAQVAHNADLHNDQQDLDLL
jgi:hypothetical protein